MLANLEIKIFAMHNAVIYLNIQFEKDHLVRSSNKAINGLKRLGKYGMSCSDYFIALFLFGLIAV